MSDSLWPVIVLIEEDELLSSWLIRTSLRNGSYPMAWSSYFWGKWRAWTLDIDRYCPEEKLEQLVFKNFDIHTLTNSTLTPTVEKILNCNLPTTKLAWPWVSPIGSRNRDRIGGLKFCPDCLKEDIPYFRKSWRLSWYHSCTKHNKLLIEHCPKCLSPITPHKIEIERPEVYICTRCHHDLRTIESHSPTPESLSLQNLLTSSLNDTNTRLPWNIASTSDLFSTTRYLLAFLHKSTLRSGTADLLLFEHLGISKTKRPQHEIVSIERACSDWIAELSHGIYQLFKLNIQEASELLINLGYYKQGFKSTRLDKSPQIEELLAPLPDRTRSIKKSGCTSHPEIKPRSQKEVMKMWEELQRYLK